MPRRVLKPWLTTRLALLVLALTFTATAVVQACLAATTTEWWPGVVAAALTAAAVWCVVEALNG
ncbi:hypothetical protein [Saccharomonospora sp. NB11]|jgi:hypothetical protein|uniref:hypothetical protein n=1 Tax=Saccharomonospora sp. NB11 TaxID=1642298 RepID=UPI0018D159A2|nr:hypothetical protein [Saccharomonospora sp. NB11]